MREAFAFSFDLNEIPPLLDEFLRLVLSTTRRVRVQTPNDESMERPRPDLAKGTILNVCAHLVWEKTDL